MSAIAAIASKPSAAFARIGNALGRRRDRYAYCPTDEHWFRPLYTEGNCPLCGRAASEVPPTPLLMRMDRFTAAVAAMAVVSVAMGVLVVITYFRA